MDVLWAPWRSQYIQSFKEIEEDNSCFLCTAINNLDSSKDRDLLVVYRAKHCSVVLNKFPYNGGHILIAPNSHLSGITDVSDHVMLEMMQIAQLSIKVLNLISKPEGYNFGANLGRVAGAGLPGHLHFHVVPRWNGDTSFMTVFSDTKLVSQALDEMYMLIKKAFDEFSKFA